jgi:hypothetical protein
VGDNGKGGDEMKYNVVKHPAFSINSAIMRRMKHGERPGGFSTIQEMFIFQYKQCIKEKHILGQIEALIMLTYYKNVSTHYYLETPELYDFLSQMKIKDIKSITGDMLDGIEMLPISQLAGGDELWGSTGHIHYYSEEPALSFLVLKSKNTGKITLCLMRNNDIVNYGIDFSADAIYGAGWRDDNPDYPTIQVVTDTQLVVNFLAYITMFPELVTKRQPEGQPIMYSEKQCRIIKSSESLIDRTGVTPHFRRGHFAHLVSPRYKKARGKIIFVKSAFIGAGKSKTILDSEEARR